MASLTLKDLPEPLLERLRQQAEADHRSLNKEAIFLLETALQETRPPDQAGPSQDGAQQVAAWRKLSGRWSAEEAAAEELGAIYQARTAGRDVDL
jgi:plasmid stability protein